MMRKYVLPFFCLALAGALQISAQTINVTTSRNNNWRTGSNTSEKILTTTNVTMTTFGKVCSAPVDGGIYAQPLIVTQVPFTVGTTTTKHNIAYVVTQNDTLYAIDANNCTVLNSVSLVPVIPGCTPATTCEYPVDCHYVGEGGCDTVAPTVGALSTPVINATFGSTGNTGTIYLVAETQAGSGTTITAWNHRIHALDITTLNELTGSPALVAGSYLGATLASHQQVQRPGLLFLKGVGPNGDNMVYFGLSLMDGAPQKLGEKPYGWVFGYDTTNLSAQPSGLPYVFCTTPHGVGPNGPGGGVWSDGVGIAAGQASATDPTTYLYIATGDGTFDVNTGGVDYADSFVKLTPTLQVADYFTRYNELTAYTPGNVDYGSGGMVLIPDNTFKKHPYIAVNASKDANIYVVDRDSPGEFNGLANTNLETVTGKFAFHNTPAYWNLTLFYNTIGGVLKSYPLKGTCSPGPVCSTGIHYSKVSFITGSTPSVSTLGNTAGTQIVWSLYTADSATGGIPAVLYAFNATNLAELYNSSQCGTQDTAGWSVRFTTPTIANGFVYVGTQSELDVYVVLPSRTCP